MRRLPPLTLLIACLAGGLCAQSVALDCGQPSVAATLTASVPRANLTFNGHSGETVYLRFLFKDADPAFQVTPPEVVDAFGRVIRPRTPSTSTVAGDTPADLSSQGLEFDLPSDGIYTLHLNNATTATGTVLVTMARLNYPCGAGKTLACGRAASGEILTPPSPADTAHVGQLDTYQFPVNAGDVISFRLLRVAVSGLLDTGTGFFLAVYGPNGRVVNLNPGATGTAGVVGPGRLPFGQVYTRSDVTATVTGVLTVMVLERTGTRGGAYYLAATKLNGGCGGVALGCSSTLDGRLATPLATGFYTLQASSGDVYSFRVARSDVAGNFAPSVAIYDPQGGLVDSLGPASAVSNAAASKAVTFRNSGTYLVLVTGPLDGSTGSYSINTTLLNRPCQSFQALPASSVVDGSVTGLLRSNIYTFSAKAGDAFLLRLLRPNANTLFRPRVDIYDSSGGQIQFLNTNDLDRRNFIIPADGTYSLAVTDSYDNTQSGSYTFSLLRLNQPENAVPLNCGAPAAGNFPRSLASGVYTYTAAAGESFTVRMLPGSGSPQPSIEVYDAKGNFTGQALSGFAGAGVDIVKPAAGAYTVLALDASTTPAPATFTLDLMRTTNACSIPAAQGKTTSGVVSALSPLLAYSIPAASGDLLALRSASTTPGFAAQMELYDPDGARLDAAVFGISRKVSTTGTYTVLVGSGVARTAGGFSFAWQLLNKPVAASPAACGSTTSGALSPANQFRYYTLALDPGDILRLLFTRTNDNFSPGIEIFDPAGSRISANSDVSQKVATGGSYLVLVSPSTSSTETGSYTIAYQRPNNPCSPVALTCGQTNLRQVTLPGQLDTFTFNGTGGDVTTVRLATRSGSYTPFVEMYNAAGTRLSTSANGAVRSVLPADGVYTLLVRDRGAVNLGSYRVGLQDETNTCPVNDTEAPTITLIRPTGGEVLPGGTTFRIQWQSDDNIGVASHAIALSTDAGKTFSDPFANLTGNQQAYDWILPGDIAPSRTAVIRVTATDAAGNAQSATSDLLTVIGSGFTPNASAAYTYDALNRLTQASLGDGRIIQYTWDAAGNLTQIAVSGQ